MAEFENADALLIALVGGLVIGASLVGSLCRRFGVPALVGQILLGIGLRLADNQLQFLSGVALDALRQGSDPGS